MDPTLSEFRRQLRISQVTACKLFDVTPATWSNWELEKNKVPGWVIGNIKLIIELGIDDVDADQIEGKIYQVGGIKAFHWLWEQGFIRGRGRGRKVPRKGPSNENLNEPAVPIESTPQNSRSNPGEPIV